MMIFFKISKINIFLFLIINFCANAQHIKQATFKVFGNCELCQNRIVKTLKIPYIKTVHWDIDTQLLTIHFDSIKMPLSKIKENLANVGHDTEDYRSHDAVYAKLPPCCQYERPVQKVLSTNLNEVVLINRKPTTYVSKLSVRNTTTMGAKELLKAACCNLSESFETNPSIDVSFTDAVLGVKQIAMLGLSGNYAQITTENISEIKGLSGNFGMTFIPGPWIESIQITKGTGSVANGYESMTGQINIETLKPDKMPPFFLNLYYNELGRTEINFHLAKKITSNWSTALFTHANGVFRKNDQNSDGFLDIPTGNQINIMNRWRYDNNRGFVAQWMLKALKDTRRAGQLAFHENTDQFTTNQYGVGINVQNYTFSGKLGYVFENQKYQSIGLLWSGNQFNNDAYYGFNTYYGKQQSFQASLIFQSIWNTTEHQYRLGLQYQNDRFFETLSSLNFVRHEKDLGAFVEYTFVPHANFSAVFGLRMDLHNGYQTQLTPRWNFKYQVTDNTILRVSAGSGFRTASILSENSNFLMSSKTFFYKNAHLPFAYGFEPEKSWNFGISIQQQFRLNNQDGTVILDAFQTHFQNQVVVDTDSNINQIQFYNLEGQSFSKTYQLEINYEMIPKLDVRLAYKYMDVKTTYNQQLLEKPLTSKNRAFINLAYELDNHLHFDFTTQWIGSKRLMATAQNPLNETGNTFSPAYCQISGQVSKTFYKKWDAYIGVENATNFKQQNLFIDGDQPFSPYFNATNIWGPINGRMLYFGLRYHVL
ncbi:Probable TonB-dependent outer membrane receptor precursor [Flavobacterium branchiophilum FL-15]|uniref:Probable TonB-dependent outer membrane receptor n=2 Tax=Flavobacterium branchiophilum TaxID=55197 RepID=G2Z100_FLABF|nr:Probable TonB-dependent outer membrane receptor precursor [Flavobacterium branchiophilum FL-15]